MAGRRILITGATGFLGQCVVQELVRRGRSVRVAVRAAVPADASVDQAVIGDLSGDTDWTAALKDIDTAVHLAGRAHQVKDTATDPLAEFRRVNADASVNLARQAAAAGVRRLVYVSSAHVNGSRTEGRAFRPDDAPNPQSPYALSKVEAEQGLKQVAEETVLEVVILRPPLIGGPGAKGNLATLDRVIAKGLPLPFGLANRNRRDLVSREVMADLIDTVIDHPAAAGETFMASDGAPLSTRALLQTLAKAQGRSVTLIPVPPVLLKTALTVLGKGAMAAQLFGDLEVDITHTRETLGWTPKVPPAAT